MIPFLVADRPISLSIIKGISIPSNATIGILTQVTTTSQNFQQIFREYPGSVDVVYSNGQPAERQISRQTIKMVDSGIFGKGGCMLTHAELFKAYSNLRADYGVMIDVLRDRTATTKNAREAFRVYGQQKRDFKLVGVAQGRTTEEYFRSVESLLKIGFEHIAVGGLLRKRKKTARFVNIRSEQQLKRVLLGIQERFDLSWLFALGAFHPSRLELFKEARVWGADYKGWIFNYEKKDALIDLIRTGDVNRRSRVARKDLSVRQVARFTEQELRFYLTRYGIEKRVMDPVYGRRLLIVACSKRKKSLASRTTSAWNLYDGVCFRTLKSLQRNNEFPSDVDVLILSAKYGLLEPSQRVENYDQTMTGPRASELSGEVTSRLKRCLANKHYRQVCLCLGQVYRSAIFPSESNLTRAAGVPVCVLKGRIGEKLKQLKGWLKS